MNFYCLSVTTESKTETKQLSEKTRRHNQIRTTSTLFFFPLHLLVPKNFRVAHSRYISTIIYNIN